MDLKESADRAADTSIRSYPPGKKVGDGSRVYLCFVAKKGLSLLPWKSKKAFESFTVKGRGDTTREYVHISVSPKEWNVWMMIEKNYDLIVQDVDDEEVHDGGMTDGEEDAEETRKVPKYMTLEFQRNFLLKKLRKRAKLPKVKVKDTVEYQRRKLLKILNRRVEVSQPKEVKVRVEKPKPLKLKETIEWQRRKVLRVLLQYIKKLEKIAIKKASPPPIRRNVRDPEADRIRRQKASEERALAKQAEIPEKKVLAPPDPDPNINTYEYNITIEVIGEMNIFTPDLKHRVKLMTSRNKARKVIQGSDGAWLMIRVGNVEYGLTIRQWQQYQRVDGMKVTVSISGME